MNSSDNALITNPLPISIAFSRDPQAFYNEITLLYKRIANSVNSKENALYTLAEGGTFKQFYTAGDPQNFRNVYRKVLDMRVLNGNVDIPAGATVNFAHGITGIANTAIIYASATNAAGQFFSFMYPDVYLDATNVYLTNPDGVNALTQAVVVADYLKQT